MVGNTPKDLHNLDAARDSWIARRLGRAGVLYVERLAEDKRLIVERNVDFSKRAFTLAGRHFSWYNSYSDSPRARNQLTSPSTLHLPLHFFSTAKIGAVKEIGVLIHGGCHHEEACPIRRTTDRHGAAVFAYPLPKEGVRGVVAHKHEDLTQIETTVELNRSLSVGLEKYVKAACDLGERVTTSKVKIINSQMPSQLMKNVDDEFRNHLFDERHIFHLAKPEKFYLVVDTCCAAACVTLYYDFTYKGQHFTVFVGEGTAIYHVLGTRGLQGDSNQQATAAGSRSEELYTAADAQHWPKMDEIPASTRIGYMTAHAHSEPSRVADAIVTADDGHEEETTDPSDSANASSSGETMFRLPDYFSWT